MTRSREDVVRELHAKYCDNDSCYSDLGEPCSVIDGLVLAFDAGAAQEREAVVAWLRKYVGEYRHHADGVDGAFSELVADLASGAHTREESGEEKP